jgi:hypothetical protein
MTTKSSQERARDLGVQIFGIIAKPAIEWTAHESLCMSAIAAAIDEAVAAERDEIAAELALVKLGTEENYGSGRVTHYYRCDVSNWIKARRKVG